MKANARQHRSIRARPIDRLAEELEIMAALPAAPPDTDRRWVQRVGTDPYVASRARDEAAPSKTKTKTVAKDTRTVNLTSLVRRARLRPGA